MIAAYGSIANTFTFQYGQIITNYSVAVEISTVTFTFQYGQIITNNGEICKHHIWHLHSSMVRLLLETVKVKKGKDLGFTFQYGQIITLKKKYKSLMCTIYIPVWSDYYC